MDDELALYKEKLKTRCYAYFAIIAVFLVLYAILECFFGGEKSDFMKGFYWGGIPTAAIATAVRAVLGLRLLKDDKKLKEIFARENDEREKAINQKSGSLSFWMIRIGVSVATLAAGFFNTTVFFTLLAVLLFIVLVQLAAYIIYRC